MRYADCKVISVTDSRKSLFLFPGIMGSMNGYGNLIAALTGQCNIYGITYPSSQSLENVSLLQSIGTRSAQQIMACRPQGPNYLLGWSMGGLVAYECAVALQAAGFAAEAVILIDASPGMVDLAPPPNPASGDAELRAFMWAQFLEMKIGRIPAQEIIATTDFLHLPEEDRFTWIRENEKKWTTDLSAQFDMHDTFRFMSAAHLAIERYVPSAYPGEFHAIYSAEYADTVPPNWHRATSPQCRLQGVKGDHLTAILHFAVAPTVAIVSGPVDGG